MTLEVARWCFHCWGLCPQTPIRPRGTCQCSDIYIVIPTLNSLFWGWYHNLWTEWASHLKFLPWLKVYVKLLSTKFQLSISSGSGVTRGWKVSKWPKTSKLLYAVGKRAHFFGKSFEGDGMGPPCTCQRIDIDPYINDTFIPVFDTPTVSAS